MKKSGTWLDRMERKYGRYAISDLMKYLSIMYIFGVMLCYTGIYGEYLSLDIGKVLQGQVWRLVTFILYPPQLFSGSGLDIIFVIISISLYLMIGRSLENAWGSFRFNLYYFSGILACILSAIASYVFFVLMYGEQVAMYVSSQMIITTDYVFQTMFLAFALLFPDMQLMLYFIIPVKIKWLGMLYGGIILVDLIKNVNYVLKGNTICFVRIITIVLCTLNFVILFIAMKKNKFIGTKESKRTREYKKKINNSLRNKVHVCSFCGITSKEEPDMEFRYCSRCEGNKEYCMEHLFTHEHVKKIVVNIDKEKNKIAK